MLLTAGAAGGATAFGLRVKYQKPPPAAASATTAAISSSRVLLGRLLRVRARGGRGAEGTDGQIAGAAAAGRCRSGAARGDGLGDGAFEHRLGLARIDRRRQHGEYLAALEGGPHLLLRGGLGEYQHQRARGAAGSGIDGRAHVGHGTRVDHQQLGALARAEGLERGFQGFHGAHGGLVVEGLAELEQEIIAGGDRGDVDHGLGARAPRG